MYISSSDRENNTIVSFSCRHILTTEKKTDKSECTKAKLTYLLLPDYLPLMSKSAVKVLLLLLNR